MILVDTTVVINYLKGIENAKTIIFDDVLRRKIPYGIAAYTYQEVLQGAKDKKEFECLKDYLATQTIYCLPEGRETFEEAARIH
ncbi:MAG: hypothetical protein FWG42_01960 [Clostridiales bacterium]|nr:hypothetical protein [Clostridiales bacterium]